MKFKLKPYLNCRLFRPFTRNKSGLNLWHEEISSDIKLKIEKHWSTEIFDNNVISKYLPTCYILPMFPYPSGNLHMGHVRVYSISDTIARFQKLNGNNVIHPMGWDAFGLPAENAAIERNILPDKWTSSNIQSMKDQLVQLGFNFDWDREISTCDPQYYKWTQTIFLKLFENGLAYRSKAIVNWDPIDNTVLADEQVDDLGCSWRSGAKAEKKYLTQWYIKTTKFAKNLYDGLQSKQLENWKDIINLQRHWIGECNGLVVPFKININNEIKELNVWTSTPYKLLHGQFITLSPNSALVHDIENLNKLKLEAINPLTNKLIPLIITEKIEYPEGRDSYIACPGIDKKDQEIANTLNIQCSIENPLLNIEKENELASKIVTSDKIGGYFVSSKLKDWLISRQRYWGTPIPIIYCQKCGTVPVPYEELPVKLPKAESGIPSLDSMQEWVNCKCPKCYSDAQRETDTMDTFVDSSWYYYRFLDPKNELIPFTKEKLIGTTPVHLYIGGKEHAVLHLYYARFMSYFLHSLGWTPAEEPFKKLLVQGMVMGQSYKIKSSGRYIPPSDVMKVGKEYKEKTTGELLTVQWEKMSKSKYNGENPQDVLKTYGCDTTRLLILADVPPATSRHWSDATFPGVLNWQRRLWMTMKEFLKYRNSEIASSISKEEFQNYENKIYDSRNYIISTTTYHFGNTQKISVGISRLQTLTSTLRNNLPPEIIARSKEFELAWGSLIIMLSPLAPHFCSELWAGFQSSPNRVSQNSSFFKWDKGVLEQSWPSVDEDYSLSFLCKVDGADRCDLKIKSKYLSKISEIDALEMVTKEEAVAKRLKNGIARTKFELYPGCRAILHIFTNRKKPKVQTEKPSLEESKRVESN